jgi:hypothetical protein
LRPDNRPNLRPDHRPGLRPDININRPTNIINSGNRAVIGSGNRAGWGYRPHYHHGGWYHGGWAWHRHPACWWGGAAAAGWLLSPGFVYTNPFYVQSTVVEPAFDYSQPIVVPQVIVDQPTVTSAPPLDVAAAAPVETADASADSSAAPPPQQPVPEEVTRQFDSARVSFKNGDYPAALAAIDKAIVGLPGDAVLHEFRALVLFAMKRYQEAAATAYAVVAAGPGWNWDTLKSLYPNEQTYTNQLRALEAYQRENPQSADGHFLLAYHYLVLDYPDEAAKQLEQVAKLLPNDKLAPEILAALKPPAEERPKAG